MTGAGVFRRFRTLGGEELHLQFEYEVTLYPGDTVTETHTMRRFRLLEPPPEGPWPVEEIR